MPFFPSLRRSVALPDYDGTNVWYAPNTAINSTEAFHDATGLEEQAYIANRYLFIAIMIILLAFVVVQIPHTVARMRAAPRWYWGFRLSYGDEGQTTTQTTPRRLKHWTFGFIPAYIVPGFRLDLREFLLMLVLWTVCLGVAGWCQSAFLTDASRSTLVVMALASLTAALGVKSGGIGTWLSHGYTAVNFLHRWTGRIVLLLSFLHVVAYLVVFYNFGSESTIMTTLTCFSSQRGNAQARELPGSHGLWRVMFDGDRIDPSNPSEVLDCLQVWPSCKLLPVGPSTLEAH
jgi:ferric-chelate reductase